MEGTCIEDPSLLGLGLVLSEAKSNHGLWHT